MSGLRRLYAFRGVPLDVSNAYQKLGLTGRAARAGAVAAVLRAGRQGTSPPAV